MRRISSAPGPGLASLFSADVTLRDGIYRGRDSTQGTNAARTWSPLASKSPVWAAAAAGPSDDPFSKFPDWIHEHLDPSTRTILDAGCGYGRVSIPLLRRMSALEVLGVDASEVMLSRFRELAHELGVDSRATLYQGEVTKLPVRDGSFDCVLSCAVLLHLPRAEAAAALLEFHRVLKESGKLVLVTSFPNALTPEGLQNALYSFLRPRKNGPVRAYLRRDVERLLRPFHAFQLLENRSSLALRSFAGVPLPFRRIGQVINAKLALGPLVSHYDVVATK